LKRPEGSSNEAPLAKVIFTTFLYVSPVQIIPAMTEAEWLAEKFQEQRPHLRAGAPPERAARPARAVGCARRRGVKREVGRPAYDLHAKHC
jgi:hypothetical protein